MQGRLKKHILLINPSLAGGFSGGGHRTGRWARSVAYGSTSGRISYAPRMLANKWQPSFGSRGSRPLADAGDYYQLSYVFLLKN